MKELYDKSELYFSLTWIAIYCVLQSLAFTLNDAVGIRFSVSSLSAVIQTAILIVFLRRNGALSALRNSAAGATVTSLPLLPPAIRSHERWSLEWLHSPLHARGNGVLHLPRAMCGISGGTHFPRFPLPRDRKRQCGASDHHLQRDLWDWPHCE